MDHVECHVRDSERSERCAFGVGCLHHQRHDDLHARGHGAGRERDAHGNREPAAIGHTYGNGQRKQHRQRQLDDVNATSVTLNGATVALSGSASYTISAETTYTLVATGPGGSVTRTATVAPVGALTATLTATRSGTNTANVSWTTANATSVSLNGAAVALSGSTSDTISAETTYTLVATGPGGSVTRTATVTPAAAPTATLTATRSGTNTANVTWTTANATSVTLNGAAVAVSGSTSDTISAATTYTLVATGPGGSVTRTATVTPVGAPTAILTATRSGTNTANIGWTTANATSVTLNGAAVALSGSRSDTISAETTYTLVATGPGGSVTRTATVTPVGAPTATLTATRSGTNTANVSWTTANATSVTLNGAVVPLSGSTSVHHQRRDHLHARGHRRRRQRDAHGHGNAARHADGATERDQSGGHCHAHLAHDQRHLRHDQWRGGRALGLDAADRHGDDDIQARGGWTRRDGNRQRDHHRQS